MQRSDEILVVEDEALIAMDIKAMLLDGGFADVHVANSLHAGLTYLDGTTPAAALLDFNLGRGETSLPIATVLKERGCPMIFMTGYTESTVELPPDFAHTGRISKPFVNGLVIDELQSLRS